jgi:hypothetical protein
VTGIIRFDDLCSTVYVSEMPAWASAELPDLYHSMFSTAEYFRIYDEVEDISTCVLEAPHHVIMFRLVGREAIVLNKIFDIEPESADRVCATILRAFPSISRVRLEVMFDPSLLRHPSRVTHVAEDNIIWLPRTIEEYQASLGASTRKKLGQHWRRFAEAYPDAHARVLDREAITPELVERTVALNRRRMRSLGVSSGYDDANAARLLEMTRIRGWAALLEADEQIAAVCICQQIGNHTLGQLAVYDQRFSRFGPGLRVCYEAVCESVRTGRVAFHLGWGREGFKAQLGADVIPTRTLSVYRNAHDRMLALDEATRLALVQARRKMRSLSRPGVRTAIRRWTEQRAQGEPPAVKAQNERR